MFAASEAAADRPYACSEYGKNFGYSSVLLWHERAHSSDRRCRCQDCGERCAGAAELCMHRRTHAGQTLYICSECGQSFRHSSHLDLHQNVHQWLLRSCRRRFLHRRALLVHWRRSHLPERPRRCLSYIPLECTALPPARAHLRGTTTSSLCCTHCPRAFCSRVGLWNHVRNTWPTAPGNSAPWQPRAPEAHSCGVCGTNFGKSSTLTRHLQTHWGKKPFKCPECGKGFLESATLVCHQRTYTGEKPYACGDCGRRFSKSSTLLCHRRSHQGGRPFSCPECGRCFSDRWDLTKH